MAPGNRGDSERSGRGLLPWKKNGGDVAWNSMETHGLLRRKKNTRSSEKLLVKFINKRRRRSPQQP